ncbi:Trans-4-hydroxy-L-proline dehydratase [Sporomusa carbonis]|uniref:glycyl radical protein n=1 Tax=Sporomusa carbonis TaxID=3076075 RepID=UPI003A5EABB5
MGATLRIQRLRERLRSFEKAICVERAVLITKSYQETETEPMVIRRAKALRDILRGMSIYIADGELIVGNQASAPNKAPVFPETSAPWVTEQLETFGTRNLNRFAINEQDKQVLRDVLGYWRGKTVMERALGLLTEETREVFEQTYPVIAPTLLLRNCTGHYVANYEIILKKGFSGLKDEVVALMNSLDPASPEGIGKLQFYRAVLIVCDAVAEFANRYAQLAEELAQQEINSGRKKELETIAEVCRRVPEYPARSFHEALQSFWFLQLIIQIETDGLAESPGRFDQYLYPYLAQDLKENKLTLEQAQELVDCVWLKHNEVIKLSDNPPAAKYFGGVTMSQNIIVGGLNKDGEDATNELSYMCIEADKHIQMPQPSLSVRVHSTTPEKFLLKVAELVKTAGGKPAIFNDEVIIPALMSDGIPLEEARDYAIVGCVEPTPSGNTNGWTNAAMFNLGKCLELALHNGVCQLSGKQIGPATGNAKEFQTFDQVMKAFKEQISYFIAHMVSMLNTWDYVHRELIPTPFISSFIDDCIAKGKDLVEGGARYNYTGPQGIGLADVADALAAIKTCVFDTQQISMGELIDSLDHNFEEQEDVRLLLRNKVPKYGNAENLPDLMAREIGLFYCREVSQYRNPRGGKYRPGLYPVAANVPLGGVVAALPNGRKKGEALADGISPVNGCDLKGPTAVLRSVARVEHAAAVNGTLLNVKLHPSTLKNDKDIKNFIALLRSFCALKLMHVQFNVMSADTLRAAQKDPEKYRDLMVRVAGYSAFFVDLDEKLQNNVIERTEHLL